MIQGVRGEQCVRLELFNQRFDMHGSCGTSSRSCGQVLQDELSTSRPFHPAYMPTRRRRLLVYKKETILCNDAGARILVGGGGSSGSNP